MAPKRNNKLAVVAPPLVIQVAEGEAYQLTGSVRKGVIDLAKGATTMANATEGMEERDRAVVKGIALHVVSAAFNQAPGKATVQKTIADAGFAPPPSAVKKPSGFVRMQLQQ